MQSWRSSPKEISQAASTCSAERQAVRAVGAVDERNKWEELVGLFRTHWLSRREVHSSLSCTYILLSLREPLPSLAVRSHYFQLCVTPTAPAALRTHAATDSPVVMSSHGQGFFAKTTTTPAPGARLHWNVQTLFLLLQGEWAHVTATDSLCYLWVSTCDRRATCGNKLWARFCAELI